MADHIYKVVEVVGTSPESIQDAVRNAVAKASETLRHLEWAEVQSGPTSSTATSSTSRS